MLNGAYAFPCLTIFGLAYHRSGTKFSGSSYISVPGE